MNVKLLLELVITSLNSNCNIETIMLQAKTIAHLLKDDNFKNWVNCEQNGYTNDDQLPSYRIIGCQRVDISQAFGRMINNYSFPLGMMGKYDERLFHTSDAKEMVLDLEVTHSNHGSNSNEKTERGPVRDILVSFPDGTIIAEKTAAETLVAVVKKIGITKVRKFVEDYNLKFCKVPVIFNRRDAKYGKSQRDLGEGWLLITHSNNLMKKSFIEKVSLVLNLGIKVHLKNK